MSYDALVWLLVGLGIGVAASLMLLIGYSMLEYGRLSRRFRKARLAAAPAPAPVADAEPVAPRTSLLARPTPKPTTPAKPAAEPASEVKTAVEPKPPAADKPPRPALVVVTSPEPKPAVAPPAPIARPAPVVSKPAEAIALPPPKQPQSVEAMFAQAFANDRLVVSPEPDETAAKPGAEKPPG